MSAVLAIETSSEIASVALLADGDRLIVRESAGVQTHSLAVLPMVREVLAEAGITLQQCAAIAFGAGPGSFTGVRTACGIVQGLAFGAGLPVIPVITLEAMAQACRKANGADDVLALLDARMEEVYWAQYRHDATGGWRVVIPPTLSPAAEVTPQGSPVACGNGLASYGAAFAPSIFTAGTLPAVMPHARQVAELGRAAFLQGRAVDAAHAQPLYLRNKVALTVAERAAKAVA